LRIFELGNTEIETIYPAITLKSLSPQYCTEIDSSREDSINLEHIYDADYKVFTDGLGHDGGIGASAILYKKRRTHHLKSLQAFIGTSEKHSILKAEIVGAILALWILENMPTSAGKKVTLYTDNQSIAAMPPYPKATSGQHLFSMLCSAIKGIGCRLTIR
jgi:hypothetical protein